MLDFRGRTHYQSSNGGDGYDDDGGDGFEDLGEEGASGEFNDMQFGNEDMNGTHVSSTGGNTCSFRKK